MRIRINDTDVTLTAGMTVCHALTALTGSAVDGRDWLVRDQWGNRLGLDGALQEGERITAEKLASGKRESSPE